MLDETLSSTTPMAHMGGWIEPVVQALETIALGIDLIGMTIILYGFVISLIGFLGAEWQRLRGGNALLACQSVRIQLGSYILLGIEFMIASDIVHTVISRELEDLAFVAALVAIRTAISYFLGKELAEVSAEHPARPS